MFDVLDAAERDAERAGRDDLLARVRAMRGHMLARRGQFDEGAALAAEALALVRASGPPSAIFDVYWSVAAIGVTRADYTGAVAALEEAAELCRATGLREDEELCIACLAKILAKQGEWDRALELAREVVAADWPPSIRWGALWAAGFVLVARGRTQRGPATAPGAGGHWPAVPTLAVPGRRAAGARTRGRGRGQPRGRGRTHPRTARRRAGEVERREPLRANPALGVGVLRLAARRART